MSDDELDKLRQIALMSMKSRAVANQNSNTPAPTEEQPVPEADVDNNENNLSKSEDDEASSEAGSEEEVGTESGNVSEKVDGEEEEVDEFMKEIEDFENFLGLYEDKPKENKKSKSKKKKKKHHLKNKNSVSDDPRTEDKENICVDAEQSKTEFTEEDERCQSRGSDLHSRSHSPIRHSASPTLSHRRSLSSQRDNVSNRSRSPYSHRSRSPWESANYPDEHGRTNYKEYEDSRIRTRSPRSWEQSPARHYQRSISRSLTPDSMRNPPGYHSPEASRPVRRRSNSPKEYWHQGYRWRRADESRERRIDSIEGRYRGKWRRGGQRFYHPRDTRAPYHTGQWPQPDSEEDDLNLRKFEEERRRRGEERRRKQEMKNKFLEKQRKKLREEKEEAERKKREKEEKQKAEAERKKKEEEEVQRKKEEEEFQKKLSQVPEADRQRLIARRQKFLSNQPVKVEGTKKISLKHFKESEEGEIEEDVEPEPELLYHIEIDEDSSDSESESRFKRSKPKRSSVNWRKQPSTPTRFDEFTPQDDAVHKGRDVATKRKFVGPESDDDRSEDLRARLEKKRAMRKKKNILEEKPIEDEDVSKSGDDVGRKITIEIKPDEEVASTKKRKKGRRRVLLLNEETSPVKEEPQVSLFSKKKRSKETAVSPRMTTKSMIERLGLPIKPEMSGRLSRVAKRIQEQQRDPEEGKQDAAARFKSVRVLKICGKGIDG